MLPFKLEEYLKKHQFSTPYLLCTSDAETWSQQEILDLSDRETKNLWQNLHLGYTESSGLPQLREEIGQLYDSIQKDQVLTFAGAEEAIYCTIKSVLSPGDHVITINPCYQSLDTLPRTMNVTLTTVKLNAKSDWKLDVEELKNLFRSNTKLLLLNFPHNPTGSILERQDLETLIQLARMHQTYVLSDEMYWLTEFDEKKRLPSIADVYEKGIAVFGMAKAFGLGGVRISWLTSQDPILQTISSYKLYTTICNSAPSEILALTALRAKDKILSRNRTIILKNFQLLTEFFKRHAHSLAWVPPQAGTMAFPELLHALKIDLFAEKLRQKTGILILPASVFDYPGNFFRIGFGRKNFPDVLSRFEEFLTDRENFL